MSKYDVSCPRCGFRFLPGKDTPPFSFSGFRCPACAESLTYESGCAWPAIHICVTAIIGVLAYRAGFRGLTLVLITLGASVLAFAVGESTISRLRPLKVRPERDPYKHKSAGLDLTDKADRDK